MIPQLHLRLQAEGHNGGGLRRHRRSGCVGIVEHDVDRQPERTGIEAGASSRGGQLRYVEIVRAGGVAGGVLACSSSGTPSRISPWILRDRGNVDSLCT